MIKVGEQIKSIGVEEIQAFYCQDNASYFLPSEGRRDIVDYSLDHLENLINPEIFFPH